MIAVNVKSESCVQAGKAIYCADCESYSCLCDLSSDDVIRVVYTDKDDAYQDTILTGAENQYRRACAKATIEYGEEVLIKG